MRIEPSKETEELLKQQIDREQALHIAQSSGSTTRRSCIKWSVFVGVCVMIAVVASQTIPKLSPLSTGTQSASTASAIAAPTYSCKFTTTKPPLDGSLSGAWLNAEQTSSFIDITGTGPTPRYTTNAMMLWDNEYLYIGARIQDPDVWSNMKTRNSPLYQENNFEFFMDPESDGLNYYELEINALGTSWQLSLDKPYNQGGYATNPNEISGLISNVRVQGTVNRAWDVDQGWTVEIAIPWSGVSRFSSKQGAPNNGNSMRVQFARSQWGFNVDGNGNYAKTSQSDTWVWAGMNGQSTIHDPSSWGTVYFVGGPTIDPPSIPAGFNYVGCYNDDNNNRLVANRLYTWYEMTVEECGRLAVAAGYTIFGLQYRYECWGANVLSYAPTSGDRCNMVCQGNPLQMCGGAGGLSIYSNQNPVPVAQSAKPSLPPGYKYVGCYQDDNNNRLVVNRLTTWLEMTVEQCGQAAVAAGYSIFGLQYEYECWGANMLSYAPSNSDQCNMPCLGNRGQTCGGSGALSIYSNLNELPVKQAEAPSLPSGFKYADCYQDDNNNRLLSNRLYSQSGMTVGICGQLAVAAGYSVFGVEYGSECWASNSLSYAPTSSNQCNMRCQGNYNEICGGSGAALVYSTQIPVPFNTPQVPSAPNGYRYVDCYQDNNGNRLLQHRLTPKWRMSLELCASLADLGGYTVFGVEYSSECWADYGFSYSPSVSGRCNMPCDGKNDQVCGGSGALSVFAKN